MLASHLSTAAVTAAVGPPDLCIRTSGEQRLSNFLLLELSYAELLFCELNFPDWREEHVVDALVAYSQRTRRFGRR